MKLHLNTPPFRTIILSMVCVLLSSSVFSAQFSAKDKSGKFALVGNHERDWQFYKNAMGIPYVLSSEQERDGRVVVSIIPTSIDYSTIDQSNLEKEQYKYAKGRKAWLKKFSGESVKFFNYKKINKKKIKGFSIGYQYIVSGKEFEEKSYYLACGDKMFHVKYLMNLRQAHTQRQKLEATIESLECKRLN